MEAEFYDVKAKAKVTTVVTEKIKYDNGRCAFKGLTADGRPLTRFVSAADYEAAVIETEPKPAAKKCCRKTCAKKSK